MLDGLVPGAGQLPLHEHYTDTGGATDHVFAICHLLGFRFAPRLRGVADRKVGSIAVPSTYKGIERLMGRVIKTASIEADSDDIVRTVAPIKDGTVAPSVIMRKLDRALIAHLSPVGWADISLTGDYLWEQADSLPVGEFRQPNDPMARLACRRLPRLARRRLQWIVQSSVILAISPRWSGILSLRRQ